MLIVAKPVTWTLDPIQTGHAKPEVDIMIYSVASESPRGLLYNVTKILSHYIAYYVIFRRNRTGGRGVILPPLPG